MLGCLAFLNVLKSPLVGSLGTVGCIILLGLSGSLYFKLTDAQHKVTTLTAKLEQSQRNLVMSQKNNATLQAAINAQNQAQIDLVKAQEKRLAEAQAATDAAVKRAKSSETKLAAIINRQRPAGVDDATAANALINDVLKAETQQ